jgi:hypothetical protein
MRLAAAALLVAVAPAFAEHPATVSPDAPPDGAVTGRKPRFAVKTTGGDAESVRFRIELSRDEFRTVAYTFDQLADPNGWVYSGPGAIYAPRKPIESGGYLWRVASWDGVTWKAGGTAFRLRVDDVPPADVRGLTITRRTGGCVGLAWDPVVEDARGGPERIAAYHVWRFTSPTAPGTAVGDAKAASYEDCDPDLGSRPLLYYRVVPEDEAGNVPPSSATR